MSADERMPVLVGVGQWSERFEDPRDTPSPVEILAEAARRAADDAGAGRALLASLDTVALVPLTAWPMQNAPRLLAEALDVRPAHEVMTTIGGNSPQMLVNHFAREIAAGRRDAVLIAGCDVFRTMRRARRAGVSLDWPAGGAGTPERMGEDAPPALETERRHGLVLPAVVYPFFENAFRARRGWSLAEHRRRLGALLAPMTAVAAENPNAWFPIRRSAEEIVTPTPDNRWVAFPYTKYMNAILEVDQGAAAILCSRARARALGIPETRLVHWWGGGDAKEDPWHVSQRPELGRSPGIARAGNAALGEAGLAIDAVDHLDLYSCFPCAVELAREALGIGDDDPRPVTLTGGLPYAGGPGNAYTLHSLARAVEKLRETPGASALVTGVGWYLTKHAAGVLASAPRPPDAPAIGSVAAAPASATAVPVLDEAAGPARVVSYTVVYDRDGGPRRGIVLAALADGRRALAHLPPDRTGLEAFAAREGIGRTGTLRPGEGIQLFDPA